ncbi:CGNR zinc finger domain-containing protein [Rhodococcus globerulus]|uniref:CGNR zinc finger domain-containing protein n=1 Tax=Rhodococcus globerulus TaxID=33008 RepID=UPI000AE4EA3D|nr:CGNR zinc finger domain-containing protein [Rhodococcus globerulus]
MNFADDTESALVFAASLVNTARGGGELLPDQEELTRFLDTDKWTGRRDGTQSELDAVRTLRPRLRQFWEVTEVDDAVSVVNTLLAESGAQPRLARHDDLGWHLHVTADDAPLVDRMAAEAAMGVLDLIRTGEFSRLQWCTAPDCDAVFVDLSRNRSKRYCDTGNCGNRANVAAYRARKSVG